MRAREGSLRARGKPLAGGLDDRRRLLEKLAAGAGAAGELDDARTEGAAAIQGRREEVRRRMAGAARPDRPPRGPSHGSPFPNVPQVYNLILLDTATFIGPARDETGPNSRTLVIPDAPAAGHNFVRALVEIWSHHQSGFDPGHLDSAVAEAFFVFTAGSDVQLNAGGYADWTGQDALLASWYPFDDCRGEATLSLGMEVFVVNPRGELVGTYEAARDQGFDDSVDIGPWDFYGADLEDTYSSSSSFFVWGASAGAGDRVFFRVFAELTAYSKSEAATFVDLQSGSNGVDFPLVWAATFSRG